MNRILLADDHSVVRYGLRTALSELEETEVVAEVGSGAELFQALAKYKPNCLLVDVTMPDFEPISAIREIRARYPEMRILVVSAYDDDVYVQGLLSVGVDGYHLKDQPLSDLRLAVQRVMAGERWLSPPLLDKLLHKSDQQPPFPVLTERQRQILQLLYQGYDNQNIANQMGISVKTVENHLTRLYRRLGVLSRLEAVRYVHDNPIILEAPSVPHAKLQEYAIEMPVQSQIAVLIVDDNKRYRQQLSQMIANISPRVVVYEAQNVHQALNVSEQIQPKLAFVDVLLGNENGIQCTSLLKKRSPQTRIILISAYPDREFHRSGLEHGASAFIDKRDLDAITIRQILADVAY